MPTHVLYVDDSGTKDYSATPDRYGMRGCSRHFVFGGVLINIDVAGQMTARIAELKSGCFGNASVELKSSWVRNPQMAQQKYLAPYGISPTELDNLLEALYQLILDTDLKPIAAVVDKVHMHEVYGTNAHYPAAVAYECLLQRAEYEMRRCGGNAAVRVDLMSGKTPDGDNHQDLIKTQHDYLRKNGSRLLRGYSFGRIEGEVRFWNSAKSNLIQVADITAYNILRQFRDNSSEWDDPLSKQVPVYEPLGRLLPKYCADANGEVQGFGIVKFPRLASKKWYLTLKRK